MILNKKIVGKIIHVVEADPSELKRMQTEYANKEQKAIKFMDQNNYSNKEMTGIGHSSIPNSLRQ